MTPRDAKSGAGASIPTIILCGGRGTRISEYNSTIPKPLVPIGNRPILWHIMKIYASYGHKDFVLALGWLGDEIRRFFLQYEALTRDFTIQYGAKGGIEYLDSEPEEGWRVSCIETGIDSETGTRVRLAAAQAGPGPVMVTYGDGVGSIDIDALLAFHRAKGKLATVTAVQPPSRFGELVVDSDGLAREFAEKPQTSAGTINGGFMVFEREAIERYFPSDFDCMLEREPLNGLASDGELAAYEHRGFWQCVDTPRERMLLGDLWESGDAPWQTWA